MLADAAGEHQAVGPAQRRGQRAEFARGPVGEQVERLLRFRLVAGNQGAHVAGDPGHAEQAGAVVQQVLHRGRRHAALLQQIEQHAGVDRAAAGAHHQSVERGERHRGGDAFACQHRAHAGTIAKMRHHHAPRRDLRRQHRGDVFVRNPMEPITPHAFVGPPPGQREQLRQRRLVAMERGIEAGVLRQSGRCRRHRTDRRQRVRLMQRRQRHELFQLLEHRGVDAHRGCEIHAAMHHAMADRGDVVFAGVVRRQPVVDQADRAGVVGRRRWFVRDLRLAADHQSWLATDALHLAVRAGGEVGGEHGKLDRRGSRVQDQDGAGHAGRPEAVSMFMLLHPKNSWRS